MFKLKELKIQVQHSIAGAEGEFQGLETSRRVYSMYNMFLSKGVGRNQEGDSESRFQLITAIGF